MHSLIPHLLRSCHSGSRTRKSKDGLACIGVTVRPDKDQTGVNVGYLIVALHRHTGKKLRLWVGYPTDEARTNLLACGAVVLALQSSSSQAKLRRSRHWHELCGKAVSPYKRKLRAALRPQRKDSR